MKNFAFVVGNFAQEFSQRSHLISMFYPKDNHLDARWAVEVAELGVEYMDSMFDCHYPLLKLDIVAIPGVEGPIANWGLVICGMDILSDGLCPFRVEKVPVAQEILRAVCFSWFGNSVTMRWYKSHWFEDGFATVSELPKAVGHRGQDRGTPVRESKTAYYKLELTPDYSSS